MDSSRPPILSTAACRALDAAAMAGGMPGIALMDRAAAALQQRVDAGWPAVREVLVVAGPGNNGGDGYLLAHRLRSGGRRVRVVAPLGAPSGGDASLARQRFLDAGGVVASGAAVERGAAGLVVDALLGTGLRRAVDGAALQAIEAINCSGLPVLSVDTPSGLDTDTGLARPIAVQASETLTFVTDKPGFYLGEGPDHVGRVVVDALGITADEQELCRPVLKPIRAAVVNACLPRRRRTAHKGAHGRVLLIGGGPGMPGAARLAGEAALRAGAGLVTVITHASHAAALALSCPELICVAPESDESAAELMAVADVVAIGPGLGQSHWAETWWARVRACAQPLVVDADALNLLARSPMTRDHWVLTPHPGEAGRLLGCTGADVQQDRRGSVLALADRYRATVVLKGACTLVAEPGGDAPSVCLAGNPGMATAGMGDVLTGVIAGVLAQQSDPRGYLFNAAAASVQVHASAGDSAAYATAYAGERGLMARDVLAELRPWVNP